jgi:predicted HicB family RNase H-like nuclease
MNSISEKFLLRLPKQLNHELADKVKTNKKILNSYFCIY